MGVRRFVSLVTAVLFALGSTQAFAVTSFGAKLDIHTQPANAGTGHFCAISPGHIDCTWILAQARNCEFGTCINGHLAPKDGVINRIHLISCYQGSFTLQIAHPNAQNQFHVVRSGPVINYPGDPQHCEGDTYAINTFAVNLPVHKGDYLAVYSGRVGFLYCSGGGANTLLYLLPLPDGGPFRTKNGQDGCMLLLQADYTN